MSKNVKKCVPKGILLPVELFFDVFREIFLYFYFYFGVIELLVERLPTTIFTLLPSKLWITWCNKKQIRKLYTRIKNQKWLLVGKYVSSISHAPTPSATFVQIKTISIWPHFFSTLTYCFTFRYSLVCFHCNISEL